jgi:hypothetical protein
MRCAVCEDRGWVCEVHELMPWEGEHGHDNDDNRLSPDFH